MQTAVDCGSNSKLDPFRHVIHSLKLLHVIGANVCHLIAQLYSNYSSLQQKLAVHIVHYGRGVTTSTL